MTLLPRRPRVATFALGAALAVLLLTACGTSAESSERAYRGTALAHAVPRPSFTLTDTHGQPFDFRAKTDDTVTLLFFGYLNCPDVCPVHMTNIAAVMRNLPYDVTGKMRVVFITTDPARDTPEKLGTWLANFDPSFIGLRGTPEQVKAIQKSVDVPAAALGAPDSSGAYDVGHAAQVLAFTRDDSAHVVYPFGTRQMDWAHDLPLLVRVK
ncbi:MAG TPA: SCO family protein [Gemmatimonadaceae bacterium]|nr:SCO family protein [Gemmatimonadaceae bacterium]